MPTQKAPAKTIQKKNLAKGASLQPGGRSRTSVAATGKVSKAKSSSRSTTATDWDRLRRATPSQIRRGILADPDAHPTNAAFWKNAKLILPVAKQIVTIRLDADLLLWLRQTAGYQTRINAILRSYMQAQHR